MSTDTLAAVTASPLYVVDVDVDARIECVVVWPIRVFDDRNIRRACSINFCHRNLCLTLVFGVEALDRYVLIAWFDVIAGFLPVGRDEFVTDLKVSRPSLSLFERVKARAEQAGGVLLQSVHIVSSLISLTGCCVTSAYELYQD